MCQVAHITEHAAILCHRLLGGIIARIDGVRTHIGEDASQQRSGKLLGEVEAGESVVGVKAKVVVGGGHIPRAAMALGPPAKPAQ